MPLKAERFQVVCYADAAYSRANRVPKDMVIGYLELSGFSPYIGYFGYFVYFDNRIAAWTEAHSLRILDPSMHER